MLGFLDRQSATVDLGHRIFPDLLCSFKPATTSLAFQPSNRKQPAQLVTYLLPQEPMDEIMSVNPSLRRKGHGKRKEKEVPECVVLLDGCPPILKEQLILYCVSV